RALPGACDPGDRHEHPEGHVDRDVLQVVEPCVPDRDRAARAARRRLEVLPPLEMAAGGSPRRDETVERALVPDPPAVRAWPGPISTKESRLSPGAPSGGATDGSFRPRGQPARSLICIAHASAMLTPPILDDRAASLSRVPPHAGQGVNVTARSTKARMCGCI